MLSAGYLKILMVVGYQLFFFQISHQRSAVSKEVSLLIGNFLLLTADSRQPIAIPPITDD